MVNNSYLKNYISFLGKIFICFACFFCVALSLTTNTRSYDSSFATFSPDGELIDLTNTTWLFDGTKTSAPAQNGDTPFSIDWNYTYDGSSESGSYLFLNSAEDTLFFGMSGYWNSFTGRFASSNILNITGGSDVNSSVLIDFLSAFATLVNSTPTYNVSISLGNGLYGTTSTTIEEGATITLDYSVLNSDGLFGGYVFNYGDDLITINTGKGHIIASGNYEHISLTIDNVTTDFSFTINSIVGKSLIGKWYLDYDMYIKNNYSVTGSILRRSFVSNNKSFNDIYRSNNFNTCVYSSDVIDEPIVNVFSFLSGLFLPVDTYNWLLIEISSSSSEFNYVPSTFDFFKLFRLATNEDIARVNQLNDSLVAVTENTNFMSLFGAILDCQFNTIKSLLNFNFFDVNFFSLFTFFMTLALVFLVIKVIKGGSSDGKKS